ncbi:MAG: helix-turn-helix transcriptional regulator [Oceanisphaera sp.]|nr:helix-turn-helix transcriptional regulator [Oceanisphaera sp.]
MERLRRARQWAGYTQAEAAEAMGRTAVWVSRRERGEVACSVADLREFAELYKLTQEQVLQILTDPDGDAVET